MIRLGKEANLYLELTPVVSRVVPTVGVRWVIGNKDVPLWYPEYSLYNVLGVFGCLEAIFTKNIARGAVTLRDENGRVILMSTEFIDGLAVYANDEERILTVETPTEAISVEVDLEILRTIVVALEGLMSELYPPEDR